MEFRCKYKLCNKLLAKLDEKKGGKVFIRCPKCGMDNVIDFTVEKIKNA